MELLFGLFIVFASAGIFAGMSERVLADVGGFGHFVERRGESFCIVGSGGFAGLVESLGGIFEGSFGAAVGIGFGLDGGEIGGGGEHGDQREEQERRGGFHRRFSSSSMIRARWRDLNSSSGYLPAAAERNSR